MKPLWNILVGWLALSAAGCGLSDYQSRMDAQRARVQKFDDANQLLGDPIDIPAIPATGPNAVPAKGSRAETQPAWQFDLFLRLPKGYVLDPVPPYANFPCFRYAGADPKSYNVFVAAAVLIDKDAKERYGECSPARFREMIRTAIDKFYSKNYNSDPRFYANKLKLFLPADKKSEPFAVDLITPFSDVAEQIRYEFTSYNDKENKGNDKPVEFGVYIHEQFGREYEEAGKRKMRPGKQVAIIVHRPMHAVNEQFVKSIQAALGTLDLSAEVASKRDQYKKLKGS